MQIALWTWSHYKAQLLNHVLSKFWIDCVIQEVNIPSGVSDQPMWLWETKQWAINRANWAFKLCPQADIWCGIEFWYEPFNDWFHCIAYACIIGHHWNMWMEHSSSFKLPQLFESALKNWLDLYETTKQRNQDKPLTNISLETFHLLWKDEFLIQAYHNVFLSYLSDQQLFQK